jgi:hypothetical protein
MCMSRRCPVSRETPVFLGGVSVFHYAAEFVCCCYNLLRTHALCVIMLVGKVLTHFITSVSVDVSDSASLCTVPEG